MKPKYNDTLGTTHSISKDILLKGLLNNYKQVIEYYNWIIG